MPEDDDDATAETTMPTAVTTETADTERDYSYDLAHDIPKTGP